MQEEVKEDNQGKEELEQKDENVITIIGHWKVAIMNQVLLVIAAQL